MLTYEESCAASRKEMNLPLNQVIPTIEIALMRMGACREKMISYASASPGRTVSLTGEPVYTYYTSLWYIQN